jgi:hypothetical protein
MLLNRLAASVLLAPLVLSACTLVTVNSEASPPHVKVQGLVDGHIAFGIRDQDQLIHADLFDGTSPGAIGELVLWKLLRVEIGVVGAAVGVGPIDVALGVLAYNPRIPRMEGAKGDDDHDHEHHQHGDEDGSSGDHEDGHDDGDGDSS